MDPKDGGRGGQVMDCSGSGYGQVTDPCDCGNELSDPTYAGNSLTVRKTVVFSIKPLPYVDKSWNIP